MITPSKLKFPSRVSVPVTIRVPRPVGDPALSVRSPLTNVSTPSGLLAPRPAVLARADAAESKYLPWFLAAFSIPSVPYKNSLTFLTDLRKLGVLLSPRTAGSAGDTLGALPLQ